MTYLHFFSLIIIYLLKILNKQLIYKICFNNDNINNLLKKFLKKVIIEIISTNKINTLYKEKIVNNLNKISQITKKAILLSINFF